MKYISILLACVLLLALLAGCNQTAAPATTGAAGSAVEDTGSAEATAPEETGAETPDNTEVDTTEATEPTPGTPGSTDPSAPPYTAPTVPVKTVDTYTKKYVPYDYGDGMKGESSIDHAIKVPEILCNSADVQQVNEKLQSVCNETIEQLKKDEEGNAIYVFDYAYRYEKGILGLVQVRGYGAQSAGISSVYDVYYLDLNTGEELTYEEYLKALGLTEEAVLDSLRAAGVVSTETFPDWTLQWLIADSKGSSFFIETEYSMDGYVFLEDKFSPLK